MNPLLAHFQSTDNALAYSAGPPLFVPGFSDTHHMATVLLAEQAAHDGHLLVVGAGGGLELAAFADARPDWRFTALDPAQPMLDVAVDVMGDRADRAQFICGYAQDAPHGPFDGAACLLTLHFLDRAERIATLQAIRERLAPGAPFVAVHLSLPLDDRRLWLDRYAAFAAAKGVDPELAGQTRQMVSDNLEILTPEDDEACLREAGFVHIAPFYHAFSWRGWVATT